MARAKKCGKPGCKRPASKAGKCNAHYLADYRAGQRVRQVDDLGPNPARFEFQAPRQLADALESAVPLDGRARFFREAAAEKMARMKAQQPSP